MQQSSWPPPPQHPPPGHGQGQGHAGAPQWGNGPVPPGYAGPYTPPPPPGHGWHAQPHAYYPAPTYAKKGMSPVVIVLIVIGAFMLATCGVGVIAGIAASGDLDETQEATDPRKAVPVEAWTDLSDLEPGPAPKPKTYRTVDKPRLVIFGASWCPACNSGAPLYSALAQRYKGEVEVGVALRESNADFAKSKMSRWLSRVPVWTEASTADLKDECDVFSLPSACLLVDGEAIWTGGADDSAAIVAAHLDGDLEKKLLQMNSFDDYEDDLQLPEAQQRYVESFSGFASIENSIAWDIANDDFANNDELAMATALARDATIATGGVDYAILDTYGLALSRSGRDRDAAVVGQRVIDVCNRLGVQCSEERERAEVFVAIGG